MHELPVTQNILEIALRNANDATANRVRTIDVVIGELSSFIDDSIIFYWDIISKGTIAEGSTLNFRRVALKLECTICSQQYSPKSEQVQCPNCGSNQFKIVSGKEFYVEAIEID